MTRYVQHDCVVGTIRRFDLPDPKPRRLVTLGTRIGQTLFEPPGVKGWPGQTAWIDANRPRIRRPRRGGCPRRD